MQFGGVKTMIPEFSELIERPITLGQKTDEERYMELLQAHTNGGLSEPEYQEFIRLMNRLEDQELEGN